MSLSKIIIHKCFNIERRYLFNHLPKKILLICNGETEANINPNIYSTTPNNKIKLTKKGKEEANEMSKKLQKIIKPKESLKFYISSYKRAIETYEEIEKELKKKKYIFKYQIEPLLKEQDFGMMSDINKEKREKRLFIGKFYYRANGGESGCDVNRRVEEFKKKLSDEIEFGGKYYKNIVLITHSCFLRVFIMNFLHFDIDTYHRLAKPKNSDIWIFQKNKSFHTLIEKAYSLKNNIEYYNY